MILFVVFRVGERKTFVVPSRCPSHVADEDQIAASSGSHIIGSRVPGPSRAAKGMNKLALARGAVVLRVPNPVNAWNIGHRDRVERQPTAVAQGVQSAVRKWQDSIDIRRCHGPHRLTSKCVKLDDAVVIGIPHAMDTRVGRGRPDGVGGVGVDERRACRTVRGSHHLGRIDVVGRRDNSVGVLAAGVGRARVQGDWATSCRVLHGHVNVGARGVEFNTARIRSAEIGALDRPHPDESRCVAIHPRQESAVLRRASHAQGRGVRRLGIAGCGIELAPDK